ncbi:MAG: methylated-DNA--[protein]-cysteine S-methyltransferase [Planctomycetes bacterium]|nr:methylated-DNA--[protein]-cysteine S-methyltransferase [Planctomycetota bacterium]
MAVGNIPLQIPTQLGNFEAIFTVQGLCQLRWPGRKITAKKVSAPDQVSKLGAQLKQQLNAYLSGKEITFTIPLDLSSGTPFQQSVWQALVKVPWGKGISYSELAKRSKKPTATRAVANACGANQIPIIIPCHRVLRADGCLGGWSGPAGLKGKLLAMEGIAFTA